MYQIDFDHPAHVHFIGIGGVSMSGFAELLHKKGFCVSGSDAAKTKITQKLENLGIQVIQGQRASNITKDIDFVVYTSAVKEDNLEYRAVLDAGIPIMDRAEMIGQVMRMYRNSIGVSGTHGKTTTTSLLSMILLAAEYDPTISVGSNLKEINGNMRIGSTDYMVLESCEYTNSFLKFNPTHEIILNIEADHLDFFKNIDEIRNSFHQFALKLPNYGVLVLNGEIDHYHELTDDLVCNVLTFGIPDKNNSSQEQVFDYSAQNIIFNEIGMGSYDLYEGKNNLGRINLNVVGIHNISNSIAAAAMAAALDIPFTFIQQGLSAFSGTERRFELKGEVGGIKIIDDYAHHPTEIKATLSAAKTYNSKTIWCVFQPHTYSRTKMFLEEFAEALTYADKIILADIYAAREQNSGDVSSEDILTLLKEKYGKEAYYFSSFNEIENFLLQNCTNGDMLITMGAGDIVMVGESILGL